MGDGSYEERMVDRNPGNCQQRESNTDMSVRLKIWHRWQLLWRTSDNRLELFPDICEQGEMWTGQQLSLQKEPYPTL